MSKIIDNFPRINKTDYAIRVISNQKIFLNPEEINANMEATISKKMKEYEGFCMCLGYVLKNSISLIERKKGRIPSTDNGGRVVFDITYDMAVICPKPNHIIPCKIEEINKIGVLALGGLEEKSFPLIITLMKQNHNDISVFEKMKKDDYIEVSVLSCKSQLKDSIMKITALYKRHITQTEYEVHKEDMRKKLLLNSFDVDEFTE